VRMISRGVEISIARGGGAMVHVPISGSVSSFFFFLFFNHVFILTVQELACIVRYGVKKTLIPTTASFTSSWDKSNTPNP